MVLIKKKKLFIIHFYSNVYYIINVPCMAGEYDKIEKCILANSIYLFQIIELRKKKQIKLIFLKIYRFFYDNYNF